MLSFDRPLCRCWQARLSGTVVDVKQQTLRGDPCDCAYRKLARIAADCLHTLYGVSSHGTTFVPDFVGLRQGMLCHLASLRNQTVLVHKSARCGQNYECSCSTVTI